MVTPVIERRMHRIVKRSGIRAERALEVGGFVNAKSLLRSPEIRSAERWCINLDDRRKTPRTRSGTSSAARTT